MAGETPRFQDLSGFWTGVYDYPDGFDEPVPFNATLSEAAGALTGEMIEPDTFCQDGLGPVFSSLTGQRDGTDVFFRKRYERRQHAGHSVDYAGSVNAALTEIRGAWRVDGFGGEFVMNRSAPGEAQRLERRAKIDAE